MRVAILTSKFYHKLKEVHGEDRIIFGGAERYLYELCRFLQDEGHDVTVFQRYDSPKGARAPYQIEKEYRGIKINCFCTKENDSYGTMSDLNHVFNETSLWYDLKIYFATFMCWPEVRHPAISISHGIYWDYPFSFYKQWSEQNQKEFWKRFLFGINTVDACVSVDSNVRNVVAAYAPGDERKVHFIPNFVDVETFKPVKKDWDGIRVLYPRRLTTLRGSNEFIRLTSQFPDVEFIVCGNGTHKQTEDEVAAWARTVPNVTAMWRPMEKMAEIYQKADISIVPTKASEGTSLSLLESMATGLPVITTPVGGLANLVIDGYNGLIVDLNHETLAPALQKLIDNPELRKKFGERNRKMAEEAFSLDIWRRKWKKVIEKVM